MDIVDQAQDAEALFMDLARKAIALAAPVLPANGVCYNCRAPLDPGLRFCDADCRDDYGVRRTSEVRMGLARR